MQKHFVGKSFFFIGRSNDKCYDCSFCRAKEDSYNSDFIQIPHMINPLFGKCPIVINCFYGSPFFDTHQTISTFSMLDQLQTYKHEGPVVLIVRDPINSDIAERLSRYNLKIVIGYSYFSKKCFKRVNESFKNLQNNNVSFFIEYRPIIKNVNDGTYDIMTVFSLAQKYKTVIGYSGLMTAGDIIDRIKEKYPHMGLYDNQKKDLHKKLINTDVLNKINSFSSNLNVPIFSKSSCAISYVLQQHDYNAHYYRPNELNCNNCPNKEVCFKFKDETRDTSFLPYEHKLEYVENSKCYMYNICEFPTEDCTKIKGNVIKTNLDLTTTDVRITKWLTGYTVRPKTMIETHEMSNFWNKN